MKNEENVDYELPPELVALLDEYLDRYWPVIVRDETPYIFISKGGQQKAKATLAQQIQEAIEKYAGLKLIPHQFRHLAAKLHLQAHPGSYESVRQLLRHKSLKTTVTAYAGLDTRDQAQSNRLNASRRTASRKFTPKHRG